MRGVALTVALVFTSCDEENEAIVVERSVSTTVGSEPPAAEEQKPSELDVAPPTVTDADVQDIEATTARIIDPSTPPELAVAVARAALRVHGDEVRRDVAVPTNTRALRSYKAGDIDDAIMLAVAAAEIDPTYGMPRYNAARAYASKGDGDNAVKYLVELKAMGRAQEKRLVAALEDPGFAPVRAAPAFAAFFGLGPGTDTASGSRSSVHAYDVVWEVATELARDLTIQNVECFDGTPGVRPPPRRRCRWEAHPHDELLAAGRTCSTDENCPDGRTCVDGSCYTVVERVRYTSSCGDHDAHAPRMNCRLTVVLGAHPSSKWEPANEFTDLWTAQLRAVPCRPKAELDVEGYDDLSHDEQDFFAAKSVGLGGHGGRRFLFRARPGRPVVGMVKDVMESTERVVIAFGEPKAAGGLVYVDKEPELDLCRP